MPCVSSDCWGKARLYVRMESLPPFALFVEAEMSAAYLEGAARSMARELHGTHCDTDLFLVRRLLFAGGDQLMDFARKAASTQTDVPPPPPMGRNFAFVDLSPGAEVRGSQRGPFVRAERLVRMMTDPRGAHRETTARVVLLTYRQFARASQLLELLIARHDALVVGGGAPLRELCRDAQRAVWAVLEMWVESYETDFADDAVYARLWRWATARVDDCGAPVALLRRLAHCDRTALHARPMPPPPGVPSPLSPTALLIQHAPAEVAAQLTLLAAHVHRRLTGPELLGQRWETEAAAAIPNFVLYRDVFSRVNNWVTYAVVAERDLERRARNVAALLFVCDALIQLRNWDMLVAVYGGLREAAVERLLRTRAALPPDAAELSTQLLKFLDSDGGYGRLKGVILEGKRPQFPCIAVFFQELRELEEEKCSQQGLVNFDRSVRQYRLLQTLLLGADASVRDLVPIDELIGAFSFWRPVEASVLMELSLDVERV